MRFVMAVLLATACSHPPKHTDGTGSGSGSAAAEGSGSAAPAAEPVVTDAATAEAAKGMMAAASGKAGNAKLGAVVMLTDRVPVYCTPLESWPDEVNGKQVTAHGKLEQTDEFAAEGGGAGTSGAVWVLRDCTYDPPQP